MGRNGHMAQVGQPDILYGQCPEHARTAFEFNARDKPELGNGEPIRNAANQWRSSAGISLISHNGRFGFAPNAEVVAGGANVVAVTSPDMLVPIGQVYDITVELARISGLTDIRITGTGLFRLGSPAWELVNMDTIGGPVIVKMRNTVFFNTPQCNVQFASNGAGNLRPIIYSLKVSKTFVNVP